MTQEDGAGVIYSSAYFLMVITPESGYSNSNAAALNTMLVDYKSKICDEFFANKGAFTPTMTTTGAYFNQG